MEIERNGKMLKNKFENEKKYWKKINKKNIIHFN